MALMSDIVDIEVTNLAQLERDMQRFAEKMQRRELLKVLRPSANEMLYAILEKTPVRTGHLARNMQAKPMRGRSDDFFASFLVGPKRDAFYGIMVHNGTIIEPGKKRKHRRREFIPAGAIERIKPNPWVYRAFEEEADRIASQILRTLEKKL